MPLSEVAACYRLYAACCVELARDPLEPGRKVALLDMAQAWARLADELRKTAGSYQEMSGRHHHWESGAVAMNSR